MKVGLWVAIILLLHMKIALVDDYSNEATTDVVDNLYLNSILLCGKYISHSVIIWLLLCCLSDIVANVNLGSSDTHHYSKDDPSQSLLHPVSSVT